MSSPPPISRPVPSRLLVLAVFATPPLLWAGNFIVGRAIRHDVPPITLTFLRWLIALVVILPFALPFIRRDFPRYRTYARQIIILSLLGIVAFSLLVYFGLHSTSGTNALLLNSCIPVLIMLFSAVFYGTRLSWRQAAGLVLSCLGVLVIIFQGKLTGLLTLTFSVGDLLLLTAMACFACYTLLLRKIPSDINRLGLLAMQIMVTLIVVGVLWPWEYATGPAVQWRSGIVLALLFLGFGPSFISYLLFSRCVELIGPAKAGLSIHLIPVFGVVLSIILLGEPLHLFHGVGILAIFCGVALASK